MMMSNVYHKLVQKGLTIAFAESMTGGLATYELIKIPGSSKVIKGSIIAYSNELKMKLLNIKEMDILKYGVVSKEIAHMMACQIKEITHSDIGIAITGNAGPTLQQSSSKKEVYISIKTKTKYDELYIEFIEENRIEAIEKTVALIYQRLDEILI